MLQCGARLDEVSGSGQVQVRHLRQSLSPSAIAKVALIAYFVLLTSDTLYLSAETHFKSGKAAP